MLVTLFFSSSFILPARRWPTNFGANSWLWIPQNIAIHQSFVSFSKKPHNLNGHSHFLEPVPWRFGFFLVLGGLYSPLFSHCIVKNDLFKLDLSIDIVNLALAACWRTQPNKSSRSHHLSFIIKKWVGVYFNTANLGNTARYQFRFFFNVSLKENFDFQLHIYGGLTSPEASIMAGFGSTTSSATFSTTIMFSE